YSTVRFQLPSLIWTAVHILGKASKHLRIGKRLATVGNKTHVNLFAMMLADVAQEVFNSGHHTCAFVDETIVRLHMVEQFSFTCIAVILKDENFKLRLLETINWISVCAAFMHNQSK